MFPRMWAATGVDYPELVDRLVAGALDGGSRAAPVTSGRPARRSRAVVLLGVLACLPAAGGCARAVDGVPTPAPPQAAAARPAPPPISRR